MKGELKTLNFISKKILSKKLLKKIKNIGSLEERINLLKNAINTNLELKLKEIELKTNKLEEENKETLFVSSKAKLLKFKIKYFIINYDKKEFIKIQKLIKEIEKELLKL